MKTIFLNLFLFMTILVSHAQVDWSQEAVIKSPRENIYNLPENVFKKTVMDGRKNALFYPVKISKLAIPFHPIKNFFETDTTDPVRKLLFDLAKIVSPFKNMDDVFKWLGVHTFPTAAQFETPNEFPFLTPKEQELPMGATLWETPNGVGLTFGCAACHSANLFGVKVLGLTNRFPRANEFFRQGQNLAPYINSFIFRDMLKTTEGERLMFVDAKSNLKYVGAKKPVSIGLDTSLAQVALSLAKRKNDNYATKTPFSHQFPRKNKLEKMVADSKPAVWWNLKYKNRWLSDGSIVSGNPVHTNFLWNELGRGTDLRELESWFSQNEQIVESLTAAVFASKPPRYEKFFGIDSINLEQAKRGEVHYIQSCQKCHGTYTKAWSTNNSETLSNTQLIQNVKVSYHEKTPVKDVGTDPGRYLGMKEFASDLNRLEISKNLKALVVPQTGYVPPPLDGIWARWPYFHNNSVPNLCALLTVGSKRPVTYFSGPALNKETDFDQECVGYPLGDKAPANWAKNPEHLYDTSKEGLSNKGHDERIFIKDGQEVFSDVEKRELIEFLKTL